MHFAPGFLSQPWCLSPERTCGMADMQTTLVVQRYLDKLGQIEGDTPAEPIIRALLDRAVRRLELLCRKFLHGSYPRLAKPPVNLEADELLSAVVERLLKAMREARPGNVRQFFALANQHIRWELNDLARRVDQRKLPVPINEALVPAPESSDSTLGPGAVRMLEEIDRLPDDEREVFSLVRIQGMTQAEVAKLLSVSVKTVQRRLNRGLLILSERLADLQPPAASEDSTGG
jgi:RNA polymerase sigma factor (sigma-70 family)